MPSAIGPGARDHRNVEVVQSGIAEVAGVDVKGQGYVRLVRGD
ncbi:hypothetical protein [Mesorhizobium australafricanum]